MTTSTRFLLLGLHQAVAIPLDQVAKHYLGLSPREARAKHHAGELPFKCWRTRESQKAPLMVHVDDLASWMDEQRNAAREA